MRATSRQNKLGRRLDGILLPEEPVEVAFKVIRDLFDGETMCRHACTMGLEGIVSKKLMSRYKSGACKSWLKVKNPAYERP